MSGIDVLSGTPDGFDFTADGSVILTEDDPGLYLVSGSYTVFTFVDGTQFSDTAPFTFSVEVLDDPFNPF